MSLFLRLAFACLLSSVVGRASILTVPRDYILFEGPLQFNYRSTKNLTSTYTRPSIEVISVKDNRTITTISSLGDLEEADLTIECGTLDFPGTFLFRLRDQLTGSTIDDDHVTIATWPKVSITLPQRHVALSGVVTLGVASDEDLCDSVQPEVSYQIQVVYLGDGESDSTMTESKYTAYNNTIGSISTLNGASITLPCRQIDQAGLYQAVLRSTSDLDNPVAISNPLTVRWSDLYSLALDQESVFPCSKHVTVRYTQPHCPGDQDKVRLYRQVSLRGIPQQQQQPGPHRQLKQLPEQQRQQEWRLEYVAELRAKSSHDHVAFPCFRFNASVPGYCFKYVSAAQRGAIREQTMTCLPTNTVTDDSPDGVWSAWSQWSSCVSCGAHRNRFRTCDAPASTPSSRRPWNGPRYCPGSAFDLSTCNEAHCAGATSSLTSPLPSVNSDPLCVCGCLLTRPEGRVVGTNRCQIPANWRIEVDLGRVIRLTFERFVLDEADQRTWIRVRDGLSRDDRLLVYSFGGRLPLPVMTSQNRMLIEYVGASDWSGQGHGQGQGVYVRRSEEGFTASYTTIVAEKEGPAGGGWTNGYGSSSRGRQAIWESAVTVTGIALCVLIVLFSLGFVVHHRIVQRRMRAKLKQTPAHRALLGPTADPSSSQRRKHSDSIASSSAELPQRRPRKSPSSAVGVSVSRGPSETDLAGQRTPGSVRAASARMSPHPSLQGSLASPATGRRTRIQQNQQQGSKMMMLEQARSQRRNNPQSDDPLSPVITPETRKNFVSVTSSKDVRGKHEDIRLEPYFLRDRKRVIKDEDDDEEEDDQSFIYGKRPPVEGRDSLTRDRSLEDDLNSTEGIDPHSQRAKFVPPKKSTLAEVRDLRPSRETANPRSLDLISGYPDKGDKGTSHPATPMSITSAGELSTALEKTDLFPELRGGDESPCDFITTDEFEYDDYVSHLPGSYFTMDPHAYTLTWSQQQQQPQWVAAAPTKSVANVSRTNSEASIDPDRIYY